MPWTHLWTAASAQALEREVEFGVQNYAHQNGGARYGGGMIQILLERIDRIPPHVFTFSNFSFKTKLLNWIGMNLEKRMGLNSEVDFFFGIPLQSKSDCETFLAGWFHAARSNGGIGKSTVRSRSDSPISRQENSLSSLLDTDALQTRQWKNGRMVPRPIRVVLSKLSIHHAGWVDRSRGADLGFEDETGREASSFSISILGSTQREKERISPEISPRAYSRVRFVRASQPVTV